MTAAYKGPPRRRPELPPLVEQAEPAALAAAPPPQPPGRERIATMLAARRSAPVVEPASADEVGTDPVTDAVAEQVRRFLERRDGSD